MNIRKVFIPVVAVFMLSACETFTSSGPVDITSESASSGFRYFLGKDQLRVSVKKTTSVTTSVDDNLTVVVSRPTIKLSDFTITKESVADNSKAYYLDMELSYWHDTDVTIEANEFGVLKSINASSTGKAGEVIKSTLSTVATILPYVGMLSVDDSSSSIIDSLATKIHNESASKLTKSGIVKLLTSQSNPTNMLLNGNSSARKVWIDKQVVINAIRSSRDKMIALEVDLADKSTAKESDQVKVRIDFIQDSMARMKKELSVLDESFDSMSSQFNTSLGLGVSKKEVVVEEVFDLSELIPLGTAEKGDNKIKFLERLSSAEESKYEKMLRFFTDTNLLVEIEPLSSIVDYTALSNKVKSKHDDEALIFYRQQQPLTIRALHLRSEKDDVGNVVVSLTPFYLKDHSLVHGDSVPAYVTFDENSFAKNEIGLSFSPNGNSVLTKVERKSFSAGEAAAKAMSEGFTEASNTLVSASGKLVDLQANQVKIAAHKDNLKIQELEKQKQIIDQRIALQQSAVTEDILVEKKKVEEELAALKQKQELAKLSGTYDLQLEQEKLVRELATRQAQYNLDLKNATYLHELGKAANDSELSDLQSQLSLDKYRGEYSAQLETSLLQTLSTLNELVESNKITDSNTQVRYEIELLKSQIELLKVQSELESLKK